MFKFKHLLKLGTVQTVVLGSLAFGSVTIQAAPITATWTSGTSADWDSGVLSNSSNWNFSSAPTTATFPNNDANDTFSVQIDNNGANNSVVNLNTSVTIDSLNVSANDTLNFNSGRDITLANGTLVNNGAINMNSTGASTDLAFIGSQTNSGNGEIVWSDSNQNRILASDSTGSTAVLTLGANQVLRGAGQIGVNSGGIINNGTIRQQGNIALALDPGTPGFVNNNVLRAEGSGGITFNAGTFTNNTTIEALNGSELRLLSSATRVVGGDLTTVGTGEIRTNQSSVGATLDNVRLTSGSNIFSASGNDWRFENGFVNDGTISLNSTGGSTDLEFVGTQTLSGSGSIVMSDHFQNRILNDTAADTLTTNFTGLAFNQMFIGDSLWIEVTQADVPAPGVSEPGAMLVFAAGLGTLFVARRRRRTLH